MMSRARRSSIAPLAIAATIALSACSAAGRDPSTVTLASGSDLESANPLVTIHPMSRQIQRHAIFVTLARHDESLATTPYAARAWSWSADRRTLTFHLVPGLVWSDGTHTTAGDAAWTIDAARDRATGYPRAAELNAVRSATATDDSTLVIEFIESPPSFPAVLAELPILPAHVLRDVPRDAMRRTPFATAPVTNGPFRFVRRDPGSRWIFERNDAFPTALGGPPAVRRLVVAVVDEPTTKFAGLVSGELDMAGIAPSMAAMVRGDPALSVLDYPVLFSNVLVFNSRHPALADARVRRALSLAIDRQRLIDAAVAGFGTAAAGPIPPDHPMAPSTEQRSHDTVAADALLDAAGWRRGSDGRRTRNGSPLRLQLATVGSGANVIEQLIQADLSARGIVAELRTMELGAFLSMARATEKRFDVLVTGIPGDIALSHLSAMFDGAQAGGALDYAAFHRPALDSALASARRAADPATARARWATVAVLLGEEMPVAWLYHSRGVQGVSRRIRGVRMDLRGELATLRDWTVSDGGEPRLSFRR